MSEENQLPPSSFSKNETSSNEDIIKNQESALNSLIELILLSQKRGTFTLEESVKALNAIKVFVPNLSDKTQSQEVSQEVSKEISQEVSQEVSKEISQEVSEEISKNITLNDSENVSYAKV